MNLRLSARDVGGVIMPPGMIMDRNTPAEAMRDMAAIHPREITERHGLDVHGDRELAPRLEAGVKVFSLYASVVRWTILPGVTSTRTHSTARCRDLGYVCARAIGFGSMSSIAFPNRRPSTGMD